MDGGLHEAVQVAVARRAAAAAAAMQELSADSRACDAAGALQAEVARRALLFGLAKALGRAGVVGGREGR